MLSAWSQSLARSYSSSSRSPALLRAAAAASALQPSAPLRLPRARPQQPQQRMFALTPYRKEQARTLSRQKDLPRLPIQPLASILEKYIQTLRPFLLDQADREGQDPQWVEQELDKRREWARDFDRRGGLGRLLQERLKGEYSERSALLMQGMLNFPSARPAPPCRPPQTLTGSRPTTGSTTTFGSKSRTTPGASRSSSTATGGSCARKTRASRQMSAQRAHRTVRAAGCCRGSCKTEILTDFVPHDRRVHRLADSARSQPCEAVDRL